MHQRCRKRFYVSPFMDMDMRYDFRITGPDERIAVGIRVRADDGPMFSAVLVGERRALTDRALSPLCLTMPAITLKVIARDPLGSVAPVAERTRATPQARRARRASTSVVPATSRNLD